MSYSHNRFTTLGISVQYFETSSWRWVTQVKSLTAKQHRFNLNSEASKTEDGLHDLGRAKDETYKKSIKFLPNCRKHRPLITIVSVP